MQIRNVRQGVAVLAILHAAMVAAGKPSPAFATVYNVTNDNDSGNGSLRKAITDANLHDGTDTINFNIGSGAKTIKVLTALPSIVGTANINGSTQAGNPPGVTEPLITLDGEGRDFDGLRVVGASATGTTIDGLKIINFGRDGIELRDGGNHRIAQTYIGTDGTADKGNGGAGIHIDRSNGCIIGSVTFGGRNLISGNNAAGILIDRSILPFGGQDSTNNTIIGNYIGMNETFSAAIGNLEGIRISTPGNFVGASVPNQRNYISGNVGSAIVISGTAATGNRVTGNFIGMKKRYHSHAQR